MTKILVRFWLLRFTQVFAIVSVVLRGVEVLQQGVQQASYASVLMWAAVAALMTATVSARWAYKRQCKRVFRDAP